MLPIHIDMSEVIEECGLTASQSDALGGAIIDRVVEEYTHRWDDLVNKGLQQLRSVYKRAMYVNRISNTEVEFGLEAGESGLALALEEGKPPYDEKPFFEASRKRVQTLSGGWYVTVPFRHATAKAVAESTIFSGSLPAQVQRIAKQNAGRGVTSAQLPARYRVLGSRAAIQTAKGVIPEYVHKAPILQGLVRIDIPSTGSEKRGGYFTFRRVSNNSDPLAWIHPGFTARKFMDKALDAAQISEVASMAIDKFLEQL